MFIQTEDTPNPNTLKFFPGIIVMQEGTAEFTNKDNSYSSQLASLLFEIEHVERVFFSHDFISITKNQEVNWEILKPHVLTCITEYFISNDKSDIINAIQEESVEHDEKDADVVEQIQELIYSRVKPAVMQDGGDIQFRKYHDGIVFLQLKGACSGCPSATITLKDGIEDMLKYYVPEVQSVEAIDD